MIPADSFHLRPYQASDASVMAVAVRESMDTVGRWMPWAKADFSEYDAACWFESCNHARASGEAHEFGIFDTDGQYVGGCGLNEFNRTNRFCNLGYWVRESRQREGAAAASLIALRNLAFTSLAQVRVEIVVAEGNLASYGVAQKTGAMLECLAQARLQLHGKSVAAHVFSFTETAVV